MDSIFFGVLQAIENSGEAFALAWEDFVLGFV